jgi:hypothetical protein
LRELGEVQVMSGKLAGFRKRLERVEKIVAETPEQKELADCICIPHGARVTTIAFTNKPEEFEAEMNQKCPAHGFRSLGQIMVFRVVGRGQKKDERCRLDDLMADYRTREAEYSRTKLEQAHQEV